MSASEIERDFPSLTPDNYSVASPEDFNYNCLAIALGDVTNWWEPPGEFGFYWPPGFPSDLMVETVIKIIKLHGYIVEGDKRSEPHTQAIAIFAKDGEWTHFAKYTGGQWWSKLGEDHDISHTSLELLEGDLYGEVVLVLRRDT